MSFVTLWTDCLGELTHTGTENIFSTFFVFKYVKHCLEWKQTIQQTTIATGGHPGVKGGGDYSKLLQYYPFCFISGTHRCVQAATMHPNKSLGKFLCCLASGLWKQLGSPCNARKAAMILCANSMPLCKVSPWRIKVWGGQLGQLGDLMLKTLLKHDITQHTWDHFHILYSLYTHVLLKLASAVSTPVFKLYTVFHSISSWLIIPLPFPVPKATASSPRLAGAVRLRSGKKGREPRRSPGGQVDWSIFFR